MNDTMTSLFSVASTDLGIALANGNAPAAAANFGILVGLTVSVLPEDDIRHFYGSVYDVRGADITEIESAAAYVHSTFWANV